MPTSLSSTFDIVYDGPDLTQNQVCTLSVGPLGRGTFFVEEMSVTGRVGTAAYPHAFRHRRECGDWYCYCC